MGIRALRKRRGLTQQQLAEQVDVEQCTVARWEQGNKPLQKHIRRLCVALCCTEDELLKKEG